jgi:hypothetical protein|tara:strand:+ start:168 stop:677 length:510 start_codon:yes stop_codon:yes gene_type:complete
MKIIENKGKEPVIYIRYYKGNILYIGETSDLRMGRPFREKNKSYENIRIGDWDKIRLLKASNDPNKRRWWEAWLICKLKPKNQKINLYKRIIDKENYVKECEENYMSEKSIEEKKEILKKLRRKNNKERTVYWADQVKMLESAKKEAIKCFHHFYTNYKLDKKEDEKKQ